MEKTKAPTKVQKLEILRDLAESAERTDLVEFINAEMTALSTKTAKEKEKKAEGQSERKALITAVLTDSTAENGMTVTEMLADARLNGIYSSQSVSSILRIMVSEGTVVKSKIKKISYFKLA